GLGDAGKLLGEYEEMLSQISIDPSEGNLDKLSSIQHKIDTLDAWGLHQQVHEVITKLQLDGAVQFESLSGGLMRRVLLAQSLVSKPDLLLLDEPTNHLDIVSIKWLEEFLPTFKGALLFITHDRSFLKKVATRIIELDRGNIYNFDGDYTKFLAYKEDVLSAEDQQNKLFDKRLAEEEVWIRQGVKARRTRNEGRVRALESMRKERGARRIQQGKVALSASKAERSGKVIFKVDNVSFKYQDKYILKNFTTDIIRGDKIGILGPNGCGKSTLLNTLLGKLKPTKGEVTQGSTIEVAYFDQLRDQLNESLSIRDNIAEGSDFIEINEHKIHVISYLQRFLFGAERMRTPVSALSGGERNRLLLAKVLSRPSNVLILDEPTNDLDLETLDVLEEMLLEYKGTILLVSHDREFIDNVVTSTLVFEGDGQLQEFVGGYEDWLRQRGQMNEPSKSKGNKESAKLVKNPTSSINKNKLTFKEKKDLEELPSLIESLESKIEKLHLEMSSTEFYQLSANEAKLKQDDLAESEKYLNVCCDKWFKLEEKNS
ncbi:MAG: ATP-binding cassette subfamily F protein uup, partial [Francisellaceae bacterium]